MPNFNSIGSGVSEAQVVENPMDWRYRPYNSVRTNVLHCDKPYLWSKPKFDPP